MKAQNSTHRRFFRDNDDMHLVAPQSKVPNQNFQPWCDKNGSKNLAGYPKHYCSKVPTGNSRTMVKSSNSELLAIVRLFQVHLIFVIRPFFVVQHE